MLIVQMDMVASAMNQSRICIDWVESYYSAPSKTLNMELAYSGIGAIR